MTNEYMPILDDRRLDDELAEARRILDHYRLMFVSGNENPVRRAVLEPDDFVVRDTAAFFERWPISEDAWRQPEGAGWRRVGTFDAGDNVHVDLWLDVPASPLSMGIADAWCAEDCWQVDGKWHDGGGLLEQRYITHWRPRA